MSKPAARNAHFLGTKIRNLRKRHHLTLDDLSTRCLGIDVQAAPSVSYLSMVERGKRHPSAATLAVIAEVFQKEPAWFLDDVSDAEAVVPERGRRGGVRGMALEPGFLFSPEILGSALPEMLSQTGVSGRQFAHLLIRAHQENHQNHFPELERAAEEIGDKRMGLEVGELQALCADLDMRIEWFDRLPASIAAGLELRDTATVRSFFEPPSTLWLNRLMIDQPERLKYDLAHYIGHRVLHGGDGVKSVMTTGPLAARGTRGAGSAGGRGAVDIDASSALDSRDIVHAWRDFECSFFAGALLCPKVPFRRLLERHAHDVTVAAEIGVTTAVAMRRMTAVASYPHWHYFDAYPPGQLHAVYRGNGIPLPWGNMRLVQDPCPHWAVFRHLDGADDAAPSAQISVLEVGSEPHVYACESVRVHDLAGSAHVVCAGVDMNPALDAQGVDAVALAGELKAACARAGGSAPIPPGVGAELAKVARLLNIAWVGRGLERPARLICPRSGACPREPSCHAGGR